MEDTGTVMQQVHMVSTGWDNVCMVVLVVVVLPVEWMAVFDAEVFTVALVIQTNDVCITVWSLSQTIQWLQNHERVKCMRTSISERVWICMFLLLGTVHNQYRNNKIHTCIYKDINMCKTTWSVE